LQLTDEVVALYLDKAVSWRRVLKLDRLGVNSFVSRYPGAGFEGSREDRCQTMAQEDKH
jgi:hypothetical protein